MKTWKIGIIGIGVLGGAVKHYYEESGYKTFCYDKDKNIGSLEEISEADVIFICVPTPRKSDNSCDVSIVDETISYIQGHKIVIIKSTVIPGTTDAFQAKYPQHQILFCPEFLTARRAYEDFKNPRIKIVGYTVQSEDTSNDVFFLLPKAKFGKVMPAAAAELFKYFRNSYLAMKNSFANQIFGLCYKTGINYRYIRNCAEADPWIGPEHLDPLYEGFQGFNGKCLPKDTEALLKFADEYDVNLSILKEVVKYNSSLLVRQRIKKDS